MRRLRLRLLEDKSHGGLAMVGFWFLEKAPDRKDREKGELGMGEMKKRKKKFV